MEYMDSKFSEFESGGNELIKIENNVVLQWWISIAGR